MKVLVALTEVEQLADSFTIDGLEIATEHVEYALNEWDEYALEAAVQLAETAIADEVVTVTIGPPRTTETIRKGLAKGADRAIRIWDETLAAQPLLDTRTKAALLAAVIANEAPDLVLTGVQSENDMFGATGVATAAAAGYGWAAVVNDLEVSEAGDVVHVRRELEGGDEEVTDVALPAVCTIQTGINEPRYASLRGIRMAQRAEIATETLESLGIDNESSKSNIELTTLETPVADERAEVFEGTPADTAAQLAAFLRDRGVGA